MGFKQRSDVVQVTRLIASSPGNVLACYKSHKLLIILIAIIFYFILCQISILYVISLNPGKRKKRPDAGSVLLLETQK
jgi:hypothetical protein